MPLTVPEPREVTPLELRMLESGRFEHFVPKGESEEMAVCKLVDDESDVPF